MVELWMALSHIEQILAVIAIFTAFVQGALLATMVIRGGSVTTWWGVVAVICTILIILI